MVHEGLLRFHALRVEALGGGVASQISQPWPTPLRRAPGRAVVAGRSPRRQSLAALGLQIADQACGLVRLQAETALLGGFGRVRVPARDVGVDASWRWRGVGHRRRWRHHRGFAGRVGGQLAGFLRWCCHRRRGRRRVIGRVTRRLRRRCADLAGFVTLGGGIVGQHVVVIAAVADRLADRAQPFANVLWRPGLPRHHRLGNLAPRGKRLVGLRLRPGAERLGEEKPERGAAVIVWHYAALRMLPITRCG